MSDPSINLVNIRDELKGRVILLTGGSGFLGHGILHRLFEAKVDPRKIYLLVRPPSPLTKVDLSLLHHNIEIIAGDPSLAQFGLTHTVYNELSKEVEIVLHLAADTRFTMTLEEAMESNPRMTYNMCEFTLKSPSVALHVHISTTWIQLLLDKGEILQEALIEPKVAAPNTYLLSKHLSESLVAACAKALRKTNKKFVIIRTSIIGPAISCPYPGWHGAGFASPISALLSAAHDLIIPERELDSPADIIPVDICANQILGITALYSSPVAPSASFITLNAAAGYKTATPISWTTLFQPVHRTRIGLIPSNSIIANYRIFYLRNAKFDVHVTRELLARVDTAGFPISVSASLQSIGGVEQYLDQHKRALDIWVGKGKGKAVKARPPVFIKAVL